MKWIGPARFRTEPVRHFGGGTTSLDATENTFQWCLSPTGKVIGDTGNCSDPATGISFQRSEVAIRHCTDGSSKTYLIGEKFMSPQFYETGPTTATMKPGVVGTTTTIFAPLDSLHSRIVTGSTA